MGNSTTYRFAHLSFQEFFASQSLLDLLSDAWMRKVSQY